MASGYPLPGPAAGPGGAGYARSPLAHASCTGCGRRGRIKPPLRRRGRQTTAALPAQPSRGTPRAVEPQQTGGSGNAVTHSQTHVKAGQEHAGRHWGPQWLTRPGQARIWRPKRLSGWEIGPHVRATEVCVRITTTKSSLVTGIASCLVLRVWHPTVRDRSSRSLRGAAGLDITGDRIARALWSRLSGVTAVTWMARRNFISSGTFSTRRHPAPSGIGISVMPASVSVRQACRSATAGKSSLRKISPRGLLLSPAPPAHLRVLFPSFCPARGNRGPKARAPDMT